MRLRVSVTCCNYWGGTESGTGVGDGESAGARTQDQRLKRAMLYQLSYALKPYFQVSTFERLLRRCEVVVGLAAARAVGLIKRVRLRVASGLSAAAQVVFVERIFVFRPTGFEESFGWGDDANPRVGIGWSDTKVSSLIH